MDLFEAIHRRRAVREYTADPVEDGSLRQLIEAAVQAPSAVNQQPWAFIVVRDRALLERISREAKAHLLKSPPEGSLTPHLLEFLKDANFDIFYHAPALIVICAVAQSPWATEDCSLAAENLMLAATALGLGTCWIGFAQPWLATPEGKAALKIPPAYVPIAPIIIGHPRSETSPVPRRAPEIHWLDAQQKSA
jgi:nitroreductase